MFVIYIQNSRICQHEIIVIAIIAHANVIARDPYEDDVKSISFSFTKKEKKIFLQKKNNNMSITVYLFKFLISILSISQNNSSDACVPKFVLNG